MKTFVLVCAITAASLAGCAAAPVTQSELAAADYGAPQSQDQAVAAAVSWLESYLKDPYSAHYTWQPIYKGIVTTSMLDGGRHLPGYILDGTVNAKNSYGGYTGAQDFQFLIRDGKVLSVSKRDPDTGVMVGA